MADRLQSLKLEQDVKRVDRVRPRRARWLLWSALAAAALGIFSMLAYKGLLGDGLSRFMTQLVARLGGPAASGGGGLPVAAVVFQPAGPEKLLDLSGYIVPRARHNISPRISGVVVELPIREGDRLNAGDAVARLDDTPFRHKLDQAQSALDLAKAQLQELENGSRPEDVDQARALLEQAKARRDNAKKEFDRVEGLGEIATDSELDAARTNLQEADELVRQREAALQILERGARVEVVAAARARVAQAQAAFNEAAYFVEHCTVRAPVDGTVLSLNAQLGEQVRPESVGGVNSLSTSLCVMADLNDMEVEVDVQERDLHLVKIGLPCEITTEARNNRKYAGLVGRVMPQVNRQRGVVTVRVTVLEPDQQLMPDMNARVVFLKPAPPGGAGPLRLPEQAVVREGDAAVVYVAQEGVARRREVKLGDTRDGQVAVLDGLKQGEVVLLPPAERALRDGLPVAPRIGQ